MSEEHPDYGEMIKDVIDRAMLEVATLTANHFNTSCECPHHHEIAVSDWAVAFETVDMRDGGAPMTATHTMHSMNSLAHAHGLFSTAAEVCRYKELAALFDHPEG